MVVGETTARDTRKVKIQREFQEIVDFISGLDVESVVVNPERDYLMNPTIYFYKDGDVEGIVSDVQEFLKERHHIIVQLSCTRSCLKGYLARPRWGLSFITTAP